jgi:hypothetical protein
MACRVTILIKNVDFFDLSDILSGFEECLLKPISRTASVVAPS